MKRARTSALLAPSTAVVGALLIAGLAALASPPAFAGSTPQEMSELYTQLLEGRYSAPLPLPEGGLTLQRDCATLRLDSGQVQLLQPTPEGHLTGLAWTGAGRFRMTVPDPVERRQLGRFTGNPEISEIDVAISELVLRTSEGFLAESFPAPTGPFAPLPLAKQRHAHWFEQRFFDADARVVAGLLTPGDQYLRLDVKTDAFDWLSFQFDAAQLEEIALERYHPRDKATEVWLSLDRAEQRRPDGRPGGKREFRVDVEHVAIRADLTKASRKSGRVGFGSIQPRQGVFAATVTFSPRASGARALPLVLHPWAEVTGVYESSDGGERRELPFLRDQIGKRVSVLESDSWDSSLVVLLDEPLTAGEQRHLTFEYEMDILNYLPGRDWYPGEREGWLDPHTAELEILMLPKHDLRAMGEKVDEAEMDGAQRVSYRIGHPVKMVTFAYSEKFQEQSVDLDGVPEVIAFSSSGGSTMKNKTFNVAADVANSLAYFQGLLADELPVSKLYATGIIGGHGQAFDGFLHLSEFSFESESKGHTEMFRAHEAAHQWWGHQVGFHSYRDQWLSEGFAEYSAMLFLEASLADGRQVYDQIVQAYTEQSFGTMKANRYARVLESNDAERARIGPISLGWRAATAGSRGGYVAQTYCKGALVLHMLRGLLRNLTKSDDVFLAVLRDFTTTYKGGFPTTDDFQAVLTRHAPTEWDWFFDQWVHGAELPSYTWGYEIAGSKKSPELRLTVEQSSVPDGFKMPVPVQVDFGGGNQGRLVVLVDKPEETFTIPLPQRPKSVELNPAYAVMARMKKR